MFSELENAVLNTSLNIHLVDKLLEKAAVWFLFEIIEDCV